MMDLDIFPTFSTIASIMFILIGLAAFLEQITYLKKKRFLPGPTLIFPFIGSVYRLVTDPKKFWEDQTENAKSNGNIGLSADYIIGKFMVFIRDSELSQRVFTNVRPDAFHLIGHPFGKKLFGEHNLIYMHGQDHKDLRRRIAPNFTPKALSTYIALQQTIILKHLKKWVDDCEEESATSKPLVMRFIARDMNLETSQTVFVGPYLCLKAREVFAQDYSYFNMGLMMLPIDLPGFGFRNAKLAVKRLVKTLGACASNSKAMLKSGKEPECLIDYWMQETLREMEELNNGRSGGDEIVPPFSTDDELGGHLFDFLFAAQDASTSSLLWAITLLDQHPDVLSKVRTEVSSIWSPESNTLISADQLREMKYVEAVAREVIRYRAPATLVPHLAGEAFQLTESYTIPKGTLVFPSTFESSFQGFTEPDQFDPDRFNEDRQEDRIFKRNFLAFGAGSHQCVGQRYAVSHLVLFIAMFTSLVDFKRVRSDGCDDINYVPTICPKDDCLVYISKRVAHFPSFDKV